MATYALFAPPAHGHVNPTLALAQELVDRGEQFIYYLPETFRSIVEPTGATFRLYRTAMRAGAPPAQSNKKENPGEMLSRRIKRMVQECFHVLPQLLQEIRAEQIDCILYDRMFLPAIFLSLILDIPAVALNPTYVLNDIFQEMQG